MNLKQFLVLKATEALPVELRQIILDRVKNEAAEIIQRRYRYKVKKNVDILEQLMYYSQARNRVDVKKINQVIKYVYDHLSTHYIQDSVIWTKHIDRIMDIYRKDFDFYIFTANFIATQIFFADSKRVMDMYGTPANMIIR